MSNKASRIVCRVDANPIVGQGHLSRLLALARMLSNNFQILFISLEGSRAYCSKYAHEFAHKFITAESELACHLKPNDILALDGYEYDAVQMVALRSLISCIVYIDDSCSAPSYADMVINHTPGVTVADYTATDSVRFCLGLDYCLVRPDIFDLRPGAVEDVQADGILVCFGGADPLGLCEKFVNELLAQGFLDPIVAVGRIPSHLAAAANVHHIENIDQKGLAQLMAAARIVLLSASVVTFEAAALRCAIFSIYYTENQKANYLGMLEQGMVAGGGRTVNEEEVSIAVGKFMTLYRDEPALEELRRRVEASIDGQAGKRFLSAIEALVCVS